MRHPEERTGQGNGDEIRELNGRVKDFVCCYKALAAEGGRRGEASFARMSTWAEARTSGSWPTDGKTAWGVFRVNLKVLEEAGVREGSRH